MIYIKNVHGVKLIYTLGPFGWNFTASGYGDRTSRRKAVSLHLKHQPDIPHHLVNSIERNNQLLKEITESITP